MRMNFPFLSNFNFKSKTIFTDWSDTSSREFNHFIYSEDVDNKTKENTLFSFIQLIIENGEKNLKIRQIVDINQIDEQIQYCLLLEKICDCFNEDFIDLSQSKTIDNYIDVIEQLVKLNEPQFEYFRTKSISNIIHNLIKYGNLKHCNDEQMRRLIVCMSTKLNKFSAIKNQSNDEDEDDDELRAMRRVNEELENSYRFRCESFFSLDESVFIKHLNEIQQFYL